MGEEKDIVMQVLRRKAEGYELEEIKEITEESGEDGGKRKVERVRRQVPPDLEAARLLLRLEQGGEQAGITVISHVPRPARARTGKKDG